MDQAQREHVARLEAIWQEASTMRHDALSDETRAAYTKLEHAAWEAYSAACNEAEPAKR